MTSWHFRGFCAYPHLCPRCAVPALPEYAGAYIGQSGQVYDLRQMSPHEVSIDDYEDLPIDAIRHAVIAGTMYPAASGQEGVK